MKFNTAIFYDIENLIGGYGNAELLANLSLKEINNDILNKKIGKIAIQRAYANWSNSKLGIMRGDIVELGIEPIQMFGFGQGTQKNAADIQLVIDAIDIALTRDAIEIFIIVSGDGGFSALAKKLHEYGKMVIGCAYKKTTNRVFQTVCDDFIWIDIPKEEFAQNKPTASSNAILAKLAKVLKPQKLRGEQVFEQTNKVLEFFSKNEDTAYLLKNTGLNISIFSEALAYSITDFNYNALGFNRFVDFIRYVTRTGNIKLVHNPPSEYRLLFNNANTKGFDDVEPIMQLDEIHTTSKYTQLLAKNSPIFNLPSKEVVFNIAHYLAENKMSYQGMLFGDIIDSLSEEHSYTQHAIKDCLMSLASANCFMRTPENVSLYEQKLSFICQSSQQTIATLKEAMHAKLANMLGEVNTEAFEAILE